MKTRNTPGAHLDLKNFFSLQLIMVVMIAFSSCGSNDNIDSTIAKISPPPKPPTMKGNDTILRIVDNVPLLPGGDKLLMNYIVKNIRYPKEAAEKGTQGKVIVRIWISSKGKVTNHEIIKGVSPELDAEALRVLKTLTTFEPAWLEGKPVSSSYDIPINFRLN